VTAYSPLGGVSHVDVASRPEVQAIAAARGKTAHQVALRWLVQQGIGPVSATSNPAHAAEILETARFRLSEAEMATLGGLK